MFRLRFKSWLIFFSGLFLFPAALLAQPPSLDSPAALRDLLMAAERVVLAGDEMYVYQGGNVPNLVLEVRQTTAYNGFLQVRPGRDFRHRFVDLGWLAGNTDSKLQFRAGGSRQIQVMSPPALPDGPGARRVQ